MGAHWFRRLAGGSWEYAKGYTFLKIASIISAKKQNVVSFEAPSFEGNLAFAA